MKIFIDEIHSTLPRKIYPTNKLIYNNIDVKWSINLADMVDYKVSNHKGYRSLFITIDVFSKHLCCIPLEKNSQTKTNEFSNLPTISKRKPLKTESDRGTDSSNSKFQNFVKVKKFTSLLTIHRQRL